MALQPTSISPHIPSAPITDLFRTRPLGPSPVTLPWSSPPASPDTCIISLSPPASKVCSYGSRGRLWTSESGGIPLPQEHYFINSSQLPLDVGLATVPICKMRKWSLGRAAACPKSHSWTPVHREGAPEPASNLLCGASDQGSDWRKTVSARSWLSGGRWRQVPWAPGPSPPAVRERGMEPRRTVSISSEARTARSQTLAGTNQTLHICPLPPMPLPTPSHCPGKAHALDYVLLFLHMFGPQLLFFLIFLKN